VVHQDPSDELVVETNLEVLRGERRDRLPRSGHRDVELGEAGRGLLHQPDVPRLLGRVRGPGERREGQRRERDGQATDHRLSRRWRSTAEAWSAGGRRDSARLTWGGRVATKTTTSATSAASSGWSPR